MVGYKVVRRIGDRTVSACVEGQYRVDYKPHESTVPILGKLFAFGALENAQQYFNANNNLPLEVWEAELINPVVAEECAWYLRDRDISIFWVSPSIISIRDIENLGALNCDSITLLKRIDV